MPPPIEQNDEIEWLSIEKVFNVITDYVAAGSFADLKKNVTYLKEPEYAMLVRTTDIKSNFSGENFVYIDKKAYDYLWRVHLDKECIVLPNIGNCGEIYHLTKDKIPYKNAALATNAILVRSDNYDMRYLYYVLLTPDFQRQLSKIVSPSGQTKFNKTELKKLTIPIPSRERQQKIVSTLDAFSSLTTSLSSGLPAEIAARQQQYEYYRDQLLTFPGKMPA